LDSRDPDPERVAAVVRAIASIHSRFARHPVLGECRLHCRSFGFSFLASNVRDAVGCLDHVRAPHVTLTTEEAEVRDRLLGGLRPLRDEAPTTAGAVADGGAPAPLLHGDRWTPTPLVAPGPRGPGPRLIDWDHAGVGPASYDLSTFLLRFAPERRPWILALYR